MENMLGSIGKGIKSLATPRWLFAAGIVVVSFLVITPIATYAYYAQDISDPERLMNRNNTGIILRDRQGEIFYKYGKVSSDNDSKLNEVSDAFENAIIASEDEDFRNHEGYSLRAIAVALYANALNKDVTRYGGSTITQQLVKNKLLTANKSFFRKYQEVALAIAVERRYDKDQILEMYINSVYFGEGAFGITEAAKIYFNKKPQDLTLAESTMLVGLLPAPSAYSPVSGDPQKAKEQQNRVLGKMVEAGKINQSTKQATLRQEITYHVAPLDQPKYAQHFSMMVLDELQQRYGEETIIRSGFDVTTTLDLEWQKIAEQNAREQVNSLGPLGARNASVVAIDPRSGQIRALVGSVDWNNPVFGKVNMALSPRQPGSSFKPIYYTEAFDKRIITPATILEDKPKTFGGTYRPTSYDFKYRGGVTVRKALALSLNIPSVEIMQKLGVYEATQAAQRMGIDTVNEPEKYGLSLALGTAEARLLDMTQAYAGLANKGQQYSLSKITSIRDKFDSYTYKEPRKSTRKVTSPEAAYLTAMLLSDNGARAPTFGNSLTIPNQRVAVKTGTTNDNRDAWTIGYTPNIVVGVWMGNNENKPMSKSVFGSSSAGQVWRNTMNNYLQNLPNENFERPLGVTLVRICADNGLRAPNWNFRSTYEEVFIRGTEPTKSCYQPPPEKQEEKKEKKPPKEEKPREDEGGRGGQEPTPPSPEEPPIEEPPPPEEEPPTPEPEPEPIPGP